MEEEKLEKLAKISFRLCIILSIILLIYFIMVDIFGSKMGPWPTFFLGVAILLYVPKPYLKMKKEERENIQADKYFERRTIGLLIMLGGMAILAALYMILKNAIGNIFGNIGGGSLQ